MKHETRPIYMQSNEQLKHKTRWMTLSNVTLSNLEGCPGLWSHILIHDHSLSSRRLTINTHHLYFCQPNTNNVKSLHLWENWAIFFFISIPHTSKISIFTTFNEKSAEIKYLLLIESNFHTPKYPKISHTYIHVHWWLSVNISGLGHHLSSWP